MSQIKEKAMQIDTNPIIENIELIDMNQRISYRLTKRLIDIVLSIILLVIFSGIISLIYIALKVQEPQGNPIFSQERYGLNNKRFKIFKFRSMVMNADEVLKGNKILYQKYLESDYKLTPDEDPRMTKFGRFLRSTSLDEIPQLFNVLNGTMSFVGPRPIVDQELYTEYSDNERLYLLSVKPGISGYWQVNGRSEVKYPLRKAMELFYVQNCSVRMDLGIMLKTVSSVLKKSGAY